MLFAELDGKAERGGGEELEPPQAQELSHLPVYPASCTEIVNISDDE